MSDSIYQYSGYVDKGKFHLHPSEKELFLKYVATLKDGAYDLTIKKYAELRSIGKLRYCWHVLYQMISEDTGQPREDVHIMLKEFFLSDWIELPTKKGTIRVLKMRSLSNEGDVTENEIKIYIKRCIEWAKDFLGLTIPFPQRIGGLDE